MKDVFWQGCVWQDGVAKSDWRQWQVHVHELLYVTVCSPVIATIAHMCTRTIHSSKVLRECGATKVLTPSGASLPDPSRLETPFNSRRAPPIFVPSAPNERCYTTSLDAIRYHSSCLACDCMAMVSYETTPATPGTSRADVVPTA